MVLTCLVVDWAEEVHRGDSEDNWAGYPKARIPASRSRWEGQSGSEETAEAEHLTDFFRSIPRCTVAMEATRGAHYWARVLATFGHEVKLISPQFVKPYVRGQKNAYARCGRNLRSGRPPGDAIRTAEIDFATGHLGNHPKPANDNHLKTGQ
jgi:hypothetical protein